MKADILQLTSLLSYYWLPSFGSSLLLNLVYSLHILSPASDARTRTVHLQLSRAAVVLGTLFYQLYTALTSAEANYYALLSLPLDVDAEGVKRSFRSLARRFHPDKVGPEGEAVFILLRTAHDTLSDPTRRFAYDRFGPSSVTWKDCSSARDYLRKGLYTLVAFYTVNPLLYAAVGFVSGNRSGVNFWRLACLFALLAVELQVLIAPEVPGWLATVAPRTTVWEAREWAHAGFVNLFFASLQLGGVLDVLEYGQAAPRGGRGEKAEGQLEAVREKARLVDQLGGVVRGRMVQSFAARVRPFRGEVGKGGKGEREGERGMSAEEEQLFDRIDAILLSRSLVQQFPRLADEGSDAEVRVKDERQEGEAARTKDEPSDVGLPGQETAVKVEESTSAVDEAVQKAEDKPDPVGDVLPVQQTAVKLEEQTDVAASMPEAKIKEEPLDEVLLAERTVETKDGPVVAVAATPTEEATPVNSVDSGSWASVDVSPSEAVTNSWPDVERSQNEPTTGPSEEATTLPQARETLVAAPAIQTLNDAPRQLTATPTEQSADAADVQQSHRAQ